VGYDIICQVLIGDAPDAVLTKDDRIQIGFPSETLSPLPACFPNLCVSRQNCTPG
jgi:hypothetical protein